MGWVIWGYNSPCVDGSTGNGKRIDEDNLYIMGNQMNYEGKDFYEKIPTVCTDCKTSGPYKIWIQQMRGLVSTSSCGYEIVYWIRCTNCSDGYEILQSDFKQMKPFLKINLKLRTGEITKEKFFNLNKKYLYKLAKRKKII